MTVQLSGVVIYARHLEATSNSTKRYLDSRHASDDNRALPRDRRPDHGASGGQGSDAGAVDGQADLCRRGRRAGFCAKSAARGLVFGPLHQADGYL